MGFPKLQDAFVKSDTWISCCMELSKLLDEFVKVFICIPCTIFYLFLAKKNQAEVLKKIKAGQHLQFL